MTIPDTNKLDFLWKKITYGKTKTDTPANKSGNNEEIARPLPAYASLIWAFTDSVSIPDPPPVSNTTYIQLYLGASRIACSADATSGTPSARPTWLTNLKDWIPPTFGVGYAVKVYVGDPQTTGIQIFPDATGFEWVFDYQAGVLTFPD